MSTRRKNLTKEMVSKAAKAALLQVLIEGEGLDRGGDDWYELDDLKKEFRAFIDDDPRHMEKMFNCWRQGDSGKCTICQFISSKLLSCMPGDYTIEDILELYNEEG